MKPVDGECPEQKLSQAGRGKKNKPIGCIMKVYKSEDFIERGRIVGIFHAKNVSPEPVHSHDFIELVYIRSGRAFQLVDSVSCEVASGDVLFINRGSLRGGYAVGGLCS